MYFCKSLFKIFKNQRLVGPLLKNKNYIHRILKQELFLLCLELIKRFELLVASSWIQIANRRFIQNLSVNMAKNFYAVTLRGMGFLVKWKLKRGINLDFRKFIRHWDRCKTTKENQKVPCNNLNISL